jgi:penicillin-insensitive murein DD-endopeptidase
MRSPASSLVIVVLLAAASGAVAQDKGTLKPHTLPPLADPDDPHTPAKELFGRKVEPTAAQPHVVGFYASGCLAGAVALPINGEAWQVMRLSRNRNWGHPELIHFLEGLGTKVAKGRHLAGIVGRRHVAAARWSHDHWPCQPSGRPRCRRLADSDAAAETP